LILWQVLRSLSGILKSAVALPEEKLLARSFLFGLSAMLVASGFSSIFVRQQPILVGFLFMLAEIAVLQRVLKGRQQLASLPKEQQ